jgi:hypothetical protein
MKRDKIQTRPAKSRRVVETNITHKPQEAGGSALPRKTTEGALLQWLALASLVAVGVGALLLFLFRDVWHENVPPSGTPSIASTPWEMEPWQPRTDEDRIIDRFVTLHKAGDKSALDLLGPAPVFDDEPVSETTAERRQTDFFLRSNLRFRDIWRGEPDGNGSRRAVPGRYTIGTKGSVSSPKLNIRTKRGIDPRVQAHASSSDLVVEVREGKIYGLRFEIPMRR